MVVGVRICVVSILRFFVIDPFMIVFPTVFISYLSDDLSFVQNQVAVAHVLRMISNSWVVE